MKVESIFNLGKSLKATTLRDFNSGKFICQIALLFLLFIEFWKTIENDYCQVIVIDQYVDHYSVEIKYDYLSMIRKRRAILFVNNNF
jgi:hypothetical protein